MELRQQMKDNEQRLKVEKKHSEEEERRLLREYEEESKKYHADDYHLRNMKNPEIFQELSEL